MKYFKYKHLMKKRKIFANIEIFYKNFLNKFADSDKKILLSFLYNLNMVITFVLKIAPIFVYSLIYYFYSSIAPYINPLYIAIVYFFITLWFTDINNDDYDPVEMENISQWMYKARKNKFKLLILGRLLLTFGTKILFYCFFIFIYMEKLHFGYVTIFLYEISGVLAAIFTILLKFLWSNYQIFFLFIQGPNDMKRKEHFIRYQNDLKMNKYQLLCPDLVKIEPTIYTYFIFICSQRFCRL